LLKQDRLPPDHYNVFKAITKYSFVDKIELFERLGIIGIDPTTKRKRYLIKEKNLDYQLCSLEDFRSKVCGAKGLKSIVRPKNQFRGVPQGAPLSDLLANLYLIDFDIELSRFCKMNDIYYRRYSDDLLFILPESSTLVNDLLNKVIHEIKLAGPYLQIKPTKTRIHRFDLSVEKVCEPLSQQNGPFPFSTRGRSNTSDFSTMASTCGFVHLHFQVFIAS
jgi:reverse transcriptase-like protein